MKGILIAFTLVATTLGTARAQVSQTDFKNNISVLSMAIKDKNLTSQNNTIKVIIGLMDNQIAYLISVNKTKGQHPEITSDKLIESYVKNLPTDKIIIEVPLLMSKLNQFASTCQ